MLNVVKQESYENHFWSNWTKESDPGLREMNTPTTIPTSNV